MRRKIIKQGHGGCTISLPKPWIRQNNLNPGDEIELTPVEDSLLINQAVTDVKKEYVLRVNSRSEPFLRIILNNLYRLGYDRIKIFFMTKGQNKIIDAIVSNFLLGFEIIEREKNYVIVENIAEPSTEKQEVLLRRMFLMIKESINVLLEDFEKNRFSNIKEIKDLSMKSDMYMNFCRRNIYKRRFEEKTLNHYWSLYSYLGLIQHSILHLYELLDKDGKVENNEVLIGFLKKVKNNFDEVYIGFFKKNLMLLKDINKTGNNLLYDDIHKQLRETTGVNSVVLYYFGEMARLSYLLTSPILGILLE